MRNILTVYNVSSRENLGYLDGVQVIFYVLKTGVEVIPKINLSHITAMVIIEK